MSTGRKLLIAMVLLGASPLARWLEVAVDERFGNGDGIVEGYRIHRIVENLPLLLVPLLCALCLWWARRLLRSDRCILVGCLLLGFYGALEFGTGPLLRHNSEGFGGSGLLAKRKPYPYIGFKGTPDALDHNELGYRGPVPSRVKPEGEYRIFFLGGSTVRNGDPSIAALVEEEFHEQGHPEVRVFNFGVSASVSSMELARLVYEVAPYEPDMVVMYNGGNDINLPYGADPRPGYPLNFMVSESHPAFRDEYPSLMLLAYGSKFLRRAASDFFVESFSLRRDFRDVSGWNTDPWRREIATTYAANLELAAAVSRGIGSEFAAFLQPTVFSKKTPSDVERRYVERLSNTPDGVIGIVRHHLATLPMIREAVAGEDGVMPSYFEDLSDVYDGVEHRVYTDGIHTRQDAKPRMARAIQRSLKERTGLD